MQNNLREVDDKNLRKGDGLTPLALAANNVHLEVFKFISEIVAVKNPKAIDENCQIIYINTAEMSILGLIWTRFNNLWK